MSSTLFLRLSDADDSLTWLCLDGRGELLAGPATGPVPARWRESAREVVLLASPWRSGFGPVPLPTRQRSRALKALPFALEEQLAGEIDELAFGLGLIAEEEPLAAWTDRAALVRWQQRLASDGLRPDRVLPLHIGLPEAAPGSASGLLSDEVLLLRLPDRRSLALEPELLAFTLERLTDTPISLVDGRSQGGPLPRRAGLELRREAQPLVLLAKGALAKGLPDLLAGSGSGNPASGNRAPFALAAGVLLAAGLTAFAGLFIERAQLDRRLSILDQMIEEQARRALPPGTPIIDPRAQVEALLRQSGRSGPEGLALLAQTAPFLGRQVANQLQSLNLRPGSLELSLRGRSVESLDSLREQLQTLPGLRAELVSASARGDAVEGRLRLSQEGL